MALKPLVCFHGIVMQLNIENVLAGAMRRSKTTQQKTKMQLIQNTRIYFSQSHVLDDLLLLSLHTTLTLRTVDLINYFVQDDMPAIFGFMIS